MGGEVSAMQASEYVMTRRDAVTWTLGIVTFGAFAATAEGRAANPAEAFVQSNIERSYAILNDAELTAAERERQFRVLLFSTVDVKRVASFTLGPYARNASPAAIDRFDTAFANLLAAVYLRGLAGYNALRVMGSTERSPDDVIVSVAAQSATGGSQLSLAFRVRRSKDGRHVVTDLQIEGAWLALLQRSEFLAYLQQHDGDVAALSTEIQDRAARIRVARIENEIHRAR
jgi:ABC-type transporter MlaC component